MWSGLGYYSRGRRLREGAIKVMQKMNGLIPNNRFQLEKQLPGVGWYVPGLLSCVEANFKVGRRLYIDIPCAIARLEA